MKIPYAAIYSLDGNAITLGLQGSNICDEAIQTAERIADSRGEDVHLVDDDGEWIVHPMVDGKRELADPYTSDDDEDDDEDDVSDEDLIDLAVDRLDAAKQDDGDYYYDANDEGHKRRYVVSESDMIDLGRMLHEGTTDAYSHWCAATSVKSFRVVDLDEDDLMFLTPGRNQGQIVEVSYADTHDGRVLRRTHDQSDRTTTFAIADLSDDEDDTPIGLNDEPSIDGDWDPCVLA